MLEFIIIDRAERQWIAALSSDTGGQIPPKYSKFFVRRKTFEKEFNGRLLKRDEWVILVKDINELLELREMGPNNSFTIGNLWGYPTIIM